MNRLKKNVIKRTIIVALPLILMWVVFLTYNLYQEKENILDNVVQQNEIKDSNTEFLVDNYIDEIIGNLKIVRDSDEFQTYLSDPTEESFFQVEMMFQRVMINKEDYDQLRLLDKTGMELIRVDNETQNEIKLYAQSELQDKSDRYYFQEAKDLGQDDIFISPLDLNVENESVELPQKPMVRFAAPLFDVNNEFLGILIINYKAEYFLEILKEQVSHKDLENFWFYIVNRHGEFILHQDNDKNFSFMFKETEDLKFGENINVAWEKFSDDNSGFIKYADELITYYDVLTKTRSEYPGYEERWIAIHDIDTSTLFSIKAIIKEVFRLSNSVIILLILLFAFTYAYIVEKSKKKDSKLEITELIAGSTNDGVMITDTDTTITYVNAAFEQITGYKEYEVIGRQPKDFKSGKQDDEFYKRMWHDIDRQGSWEGMLWDKKKNGVLYPQKMRIIAVENKNFGVHHYISIFNDGSMQKNKLDSLKDINRKDGNLFVPNEDMMLQLLKQSVQDETFKFMVLYIAIENYNQLITSFVDFESKSAELFVDSVKPLINEEDFIAKTGRNVFAVIIGLKDLKTDSKEFVLKIQKELSRIIEINGRELFFKTRMGVSFWPHDTDDLKKIFLNSIIALEWSSSRSAGEVTFFSEEMIDELNQENEIEGYLRRAIDEDELFMVYQPQVDSITGYVVGVEALIRWKNKKLGFVPPSVFIPIAEKTNLIVDIGYWVAKRVCKDFNEILDDIPESFRDIRCAINLSVIQMEDGMFLEKLFSIINKFDLNYKNLEIEITESLLLSNQDKSIRMLKNMQGAGLKIAIDDFGTGYSSLSYLKTLPIDKIKIDRSFIKDYPTYDDGKLAGVLVNMAETLGIDVLAEGAETLEQVEFLSNKGCSKIQGYYYSKPLEKSVFIEYMNKR